LFSPNRERLNKTGQDGILRRLAYSLIRKKAKGETIFGLCFFLPYQQGNNFTRKGGRSGAPTPLEGLSKFNGKIVLGEVL